MISKESIEKMRQHQDCTLGMIQRFERMNSQMRALLKDVKKRHPDLYDMLDETKDLE